jgi:large subunit ribosomal protein L9
MKVVLREHVEHLGERGEVVRVAPGYARNYLLPKRLALEATAGNLKVVEHQQKLWTVKETKEVGEAEQLAARLAELDLKVVKKAGESGTLYGSVTNVEVAELLAAKGVEIDRRRIVLGDPIKAVGTYDITVKLHHKVTGQIKLLVDAEETASPAS